MMKLGSMRVWTAKCPRHPNQKYANPLELPASCECCHAIAAAGLAYDKLTLAQIRAERAVEDEARARRRA